MALYRKKPALREATQWLGPGYLAAGVEREWVPNYGTDTEGVYRYYVVTTHGQKTFVQPGDYIVREPDGNGHYPCKAEIFEREHEPVA